MNSIPNQFFSDELLAQVSKAMIAELEQTKSFIHKNCDQNKVNEKIEFLESKGITIDVTMQGIASSAVCEHNNIRLSYMPLIDYMSFCEDNVIETMPCSNFMQYLCFVEDKFL